MPRRVGYKVTRPGRKADDPEIELPIAQDIRSEPGIPRRDNEVSYYAREFPLESVAEEQSASAQWALDVREEAAPATAELYREHAEAITPIVEWLKTTGDQQPTAEPSGEDVSDVIRAKARELGYGEVGFTRFDRRYVYQAKRQYVRGELATAICLAVEQDYVKSQEIPSLESESAHGEAHERQGELAKKMVEFIHSLGYRCQVWGPTWHFGPMIPLFVDAGLGQLGINGQLLSPHFGSRARLQVITTNAKLNLDAPVDYGIHKFCDLCQVCSMRCPGRAITPDKVWFRGVEKNKLVFKRCRPVMTRYSGCGVCIKVCPIQKYGMKPVMDHYIETGEVLGKSSPNLEGYTLPDKGYFAPGKLPRFDSDFFDMPLGRAEDWLVDRFKEKLESEDANGDGAKDKLWEEYRHDLERSLELKALPVDMGMDLGG